MKFTLSSFLHIYEYIHQGHLSRLNHFLLAFMKNTLKTFICPRQVPNYLPFFKICIVKRWQRWVPSRKTGRIFSFQKHERKSKFFLDDFVPLLFNNTSFWRQIREGFGNDKRIHGLWIILSATHLVFFSILRSLFPYPGLDHYHFLLNYNNSFLTDL